MVLAPGVRLGPYEVISLLGEGGMGKVWRAHHTALRRDDALKVLPEAFAADPDRLARFRREAQVLASLNHPNIAHVYGLEQADPSTSSGQAGVQALVMELVEGPTLADRIAQGPIPVDEALSIATQIAEALEAAHERGIIHRDLKPANVKVRPDGTVKVLDFGLAKLISPPEGGHYVQNGRSVRLQPDLTASPTITSPAMMTGDGRLLGTAAYMSPEQARGRAADKRSDIWAFGCVLYEMLTGKAVFGGDNVGDSLAAVLRGEPDWSALPSHTPDTTRTLLRGCLMKDHQHRFADIAVVQFLLKELVPSGGIHHDAHRWKLASVGLLITLLVGLAAVIYAYATRNVVTPTLIRSAIPMSGSTVIAFSGSDRDIAITPNGSSVAYRGSSGTQVFVRALSQLDPTPLGTAGQPRGLFASPDGQWIGYFDGVTILKKVPITGGPSITVGRVDGSGPRGATWGPDGTIVFGTLNTASGLFKVPETGGEPTLLTQPDHKLGEGDHVWPEFLPGGQQVLFTILSGALENAQIAVLDLRTGTKKMVLRGGSHARYVSTGHLVYAAGGVLRAAVFDLNRLEVVGAPVQVLDRLLTMSSGAADFDVADNGTLVYVSGDQTTAARRLVWLDRRGQESPISAPLRAYQYPRISPDGTRVALDIRDQENDIWIWDFTRATLTRFTFDPTLDRFPMWTPDGRRLLFSSDRGGTANVFAQSADGTGRIVRLTNSSNDQFPVGISPDGTRIVLRENPAVNLGSANLMVLSVGTSDASLEGQGGSGQDVANAAQPLLPSTGSLVNNGAVSPNGRWLAYQSDESGRDEIYVRPFPEVEAGRWQISTNGGRQPVWGRDGRELFYLTIGGGALMRVAIENAASWSAGSPSTFLNGPFFDSGGSAGAAAYDISPDGQRFLMIKVGGASAQTVPVPNLVIVQNWTEELKQRVPTR